MEPNSTDRNPESQASAETPAGTTPDSSKEAYAIHPSELPPLTASFEEDEDEDTDGFLLVAGDRLSEFLDRLPEYAAYFVSAYRVPLLAIALVVGGYISVRVLVEVLASLETIPLISPALELIGMGYTIWFIYRYAIGAENRQELWVQLSKIKDYILSDKTSQ